MFEELPQPRAMILTRYGKMPGARGRTFFTPLGPPEVKNIHRIRKQRLAVLLDMGMFVNVTNTLIVRVFLW